MRMFYLNIQVEPDVISEISLPLLATTYKLTVMSVRRCRCHRVSVMGHPCVHPNSLAISVGKEDRETISAPGPEYPFRQK